MKYMLMRIGQMKQRQSIFFDLYNPMKKKNIELHYSCRCRRYDLNKIDKVFGELRRKTTPISLNEIDELMESCVIE